MNGRILLGLAATVAITLLGASVASAHPPPVPAAPDPNLVPLFLSSPDEESLALSDVADSGVGQSRFQTNTYDLIECCYTYSVTTTASFAGTDYRLDPRDDYDAQVSLEWQRYGGIELYYQEIAGSVEAILQVNCEFYAAPPAELREDFGSATLLFHFDHAGSVPEEQACDASEDWAHDVFLTLTFREAYHNDFSFGLLNSGMEFVVHTAGESFVTVRSFSPQDAAAEPVAEAGNGTTNGTVDPPATGNETGGNETGGNETSVEGGSSAAEGGEAPEPAPEEQTAGGDDVATLPGASVGLLLGGLSATLMARRRAGRN